MVEVKDLLIAVIKSVHVCESMCGVVWHLRVRVIVPWHEAKFDLFNVR